MSGPLPLGAGGRIAFEWAGSVQPFCEAAGGGAIHLASPLQRRLRDVDAITQHMLVRTDTLTTAGAILAGQEPDVPVF